MQYHVSGHGVYKLQYHIVWVCKYRRRVLKPGVREYLEKVLRGMLRRMPGVEIETFGSDLDHIHLVMDIPPKYSVADVIAELKSRSSSTMRRKFQWLAKVYWKENILWSPGYFASTIGADEQTIKRYVEQQGLQDSGEELQLL